MKQAYWNSAALDFESDVCDITREETADLVKRHVALARPKRKDSVLVDLGCGVGTFIGRYGPRFHEVIGVEFAPRIIAQAIERVRGEAGVLVLTDMFGGTPSNLGMTFLETDRVEVITGVNLPMLIKLASLRSSQDLLAVAREMRDHGRSAIWVASDLLRGDKS